MHSNLRKMRAELQDDLVHYYLTTDENEIHFNELIGKTITINYQHKINCKACGAETKKSFQGFCYKCFITRPEAEECVLRPELCQAEEGIARDMEFAKNHCLIDHYVYLAVSSHLKVGVTRHHQIPTRWIDQGASYAIKLAQTPNRRIAGEIEVELKNYYSDKTSWQRMLKNEINHDIDLIESKQEAYEYLPEELAVYLSEDDTITHLNYPLLEIPQKIKSINLDKIDHIEGILTGIKAQYLIFDNQFVMNVRKFEGYNIEIDF